ncbi:MAG: ABC transporter permease, partial [Thermoanaerobaculia bacterium]
LVSGFLYRPIPYQDVDRLMLIGERNSDLLKGQLTTTSPANFLDFRERQSSFQQLAAFEGGVVSYDSGGDRPEQLAAGKVTPGFFELVGVEPVQGRPFLAEEGVRGRDRVVLLSHEFWTERYGGDTDPSGETLELNGEHYDVLGVIGEDFEWILAPNTKVWLPLVLEHDSAPRQRRSTFAIGRLADGVSDDGARAEMETLMAQLVDEYPDANRGYEVQLLNLREDVPDSRNRIFFAMIQVALLFVLLIACANVANLLLSRSQAREREIAIRNSIGASRGRIVFQLFTESMIMALIAGAVGIGLGLVGIKLVGNALGGFLPSFWIPTLDLRVLAYSLAVTVFGGVLFGLAPVLQTARFDLLSGLKDGNQGATMGGRRRWASNALVVLELAFAVAFLAGASMMIRTFQTMQTSEAGFDTGNLLVMQVDLPDSRYGSETEQNLGAEQVVTHLGAIPGVRAATVSNLFPRMPFLADETFEIEGQVLAEDQALPQAGWLSAGLDYFQTLGVRLQKGRGFTAADQVGRPPVAVINAAMAERYWSGENPIGKRLTIQGARREIVGVVDTVHHDFLISDSGGKPFVYLPWKQSPATTFAVALRTDVEPGTLTESVRRELLAFDRSASVTQVQTLDAFIEQFWVGQNVFTVILGGFGVLALVLAALGTYGVLAYSVARRTHEIGIRMAIGANRGAVLKMIIRQGLLLGVLGLLLGIPLILAQIKIISGIFAGLVPVEPTSVLGVVAVLAVVTLVASALPARRAASVDPIEALRCE